jgi:hypothetical protein
VRRGDNHVSRPKERAVSFDRAAVFYAGACDILSSDDYELTAGERAIAYACLSAAESLADIARRATSRALADGGGNADLAAGLMEAAAHRLMTRLGEDH